MKGKYYNVNDIKYIGNELYKMNDFYSQDLDKRDASGKIVPTAARIKLYNSDLNVLDELSHYNVNSIYKNIINNYRNTLMKEKAKLSA